MIQFYDILIPIGTFLLGYFVGGIPVSVIIGKIFFKQDITKFGSGNPGGTNATRLWGKKVGFTVIVLDAIKALAPFWIILLTFRLCLPENFMNPEALEWSIWLTALGSVIGHCYSIYLKFKGGKGVSTFVGTIGFSSITQFCIGVITFFTTLGTKKYVSLSSIVLASVATVVSWVLYILWLTVDPNIINLTFIFYSPLIHMSHAYPIVVTLMACVVIIRHIPNIKRILNGTENKIKSKRLVDN